MLSKINKDNVEELFNKDLITAVSLKGIEVAKIYGAWNALDGVDEIYYLITLKKNLH